MARKAIDLTGKIFGSLTVIQRSKTKNKLHAYWDCVCECNPTKVISICAQSLINGNTKSCGCGKGNKKHGLSNTNFYFVWSAMKQRCDNENNINYKHYGERGIDYSEDWDFFEKFFEDMYEEYEEHIKQFGRNETQLERINNNKGYSKDNCCWVTRQENLNNRRPRRKKQC